eukprot:3559965-Prymnesium_polylepis.1
MSHDKARRGPGRRARPRRKHGGRKGQARRERELVTRKIEHRRRHTANGTATAERCASDTTVDRRPRGGSR